MLPVTEWKGLSIVPAFYVEWFIGMHQAAFGFGKRSPVCGLFLHLCGDILPFHPSYVFLSLPCSHLFKFHFFPTLFAIHAGFPSLFQDLPWARRVSHLFFFSNSLSTPHTFTPPPRNPGVRGWRLCVLLFRALFEEVLTLLFLRVCAWKDGSDEPDPGLGLWLS